MSPVRRCFAVCGLMLLTPLSARAIIFNSTGDPNYNITAPGGALAGSGWQYTGDWAGGFTGTPVAPQYFLSAKHIGGTLGGGFVYNGVSYTTTAVTNIADTDLRLWKIDGTFPTFAPMWSSSDGSELNALNGNFVGVGRGTQRGAEIFHQTSGQFKGWAWGVRDFVQRWGENKTSGFLDWSATGDQKIITFNFDASGSGNAGANEFALSTGDSGGGAYLRVNGTGPWKLIGIMSGVSGPYSYNNTTNDPNDPHFSAALIDRGGYWDWTFQNNQQFVTDLPTNVPSYGILSRISNNLSLINAAMTGAPVWNVDAGGNWSTGSNWWKGTAPSGVGAEAILGNVITQQRTVTLNSSVTLGTLTFDDPAGYAIGAGGGTLTIDTSGADGVINVNAGSHSIAAPVTLSKNTVVTVLPAPSTLTMSGTLNASGVTLTKNGAGNLSVKNVRSAGLVINGGGVLIGANGTSAGVSHVGTLAIADEGYLDLADNDLIVDYSGASQFNQIRNWVIEGFSGTPIGAGVSGIHSVTSQNNGGQTILALFDNALFGLSQWEGLSVPTQSVIGKYTYFGDANLDGQVTGDDYTVIDANLNTTPAPGAAWLSGDMNLDGIVTGDDYTVIDANLGLGNGNPLSAASIARGASLSSVPEPGLGVAIVAMASLMGLRRKK